MSALTELLQRHVAEGTAPGIIAARGHATGALEVAAAGELAPTAIVRIKSMTKPIVTVAALRLVQAGTIGLDDPVERWLPELADRRVLRSPEADLADTVPADGPITVRHLLSCTSGYGMILAPSPLQAAMRASEVEGGPEPVSLGTDAWLAALAELPLAFQPGTGWRYHHSFALLGILLSRLVGRPLGDHLADDLLGPLGMADTAFWVPQQQAHRLPAAYRRDEAGALVQLEPAAAGFYAGPPPFDVSHHELVSTIGDCTTFARMLAADGRHDGHRVLDAALLRQMRTDQVPRSAKTEESFFPGFWDTTGWGYGVGVQVSGRHPGRYGWFGGLGTDLFVDPDGSFGVLFTQVEMGAHVLRLIEDFQQL